MDVAIVGGSLAGSSAAILLHRAGHRVRVFERTTGVLVGRGGGIGVPGRVLQTLIRYDMIDADFPHVMGTTTPFVVRTDEHPRMGYRPWEMPTDTATFHWSALWRQLHKRVPEDSFFAGCEVRSTEQRPDGKIVVQLDDGSEQLFDVVIHADGRLSENRPRLFPEFDEKYRGYVLWRGLIPESAVDGSESLDGTVPRVSYTDGAGHLVASHLPSAKGSTASGDRLIDWAAYVEVPEERLEEFMTDRKGVVRQDTLPAGTMRAEEEQRLKTQLCDVLPDFFAELVERTKSTKAHPIYTVKMPAYRNGLQVVIGDAGTVTPPFTGSGVFKGFQNIAGLLETMQSHRSLDDVLESWSTKQLRLGARLLALAEQMEQAFIWNPLDLASADANSTEAWWNASVTFSQGLSHGTTQQAGSTP